MRTPSRPRDERLPVPPASVYRHYDVDLLLGELDDVVFLGVVDEFGVPRGGIENSASVGREWFGATFERYRSEATPLVFETFSG